MGESVVVFDPPHPWARFRAWDSLALGAAGWIEYLQGVARKHPDYLPAMNAGDIRTVAHVLKVAGYYTDREDHYRAAMMSNRALLERQLGPPP